MSKINKILDQMRKNPRDWRIESLKAVAKRLGIKVRKPPESHVIFQHASSMIEVSVPAHRSMGALRNFYT